MGDVHRLGEEGFALCGDKLDEISLSDYSLEDGEITCEACKKAHHQEEVDRLRRLFGFLDLTEEGWEKFYSAWREELQIARDLLEMRGIPEGTLDSTVLFQDAGMKALKKAGVEVKRCPTCGSPVFEFEGGGGKKKITPEAGHG